VYLDKATQHRISQLENLFNARIVTGLSMLPLLQKSSQGAAQTLPQTEANGFGALATKYASLYLPSAINCTYLPASV
jgi:hypothetical protein